MLYVIFFAMAAVIVFLTVKLCLMKKAAKEITSEFSRIVGDDTNALIGISSCDRDMQKLADNIDVDLSKSIKKDDPESPEALLAALTEKTKGGAE